MDATLTFGDIDQTLFIPATPDAIYHALIDGDAHAAFTGAAATSDARVGGEFTAWDGYISGRHLELEPGHRIVQEWQTSEWPTGYPPSRLEFDLVACPEGTNLTMHHTQLPAEQVESYRQGWTDFYWDPLATYFEDAPT